jgi:Ca2+-binding EF-hand superfamily protein
MGMDKFFNGASEEAKMRGDEPPRYEEIKEAFTQFDWDQNGMLGEQEFMEFINMTNNMRMDEWNRAQNDAHNGGRGRSGSRSRSRSRGRGGDVQIDPEYAGEMCDFDKSQSITKDELRMCAPMIAPDGEKPPSDDDINKMFDKFDENRDGQFDEKEWRRMIDFLNEKSKGRGIGRDGPGRDMGPPPKPYDGYNLWQRFAGEDQMIGSREFFEGAR